MRQLGLVSKIAGVLLLATAVSSAWSQTARARDPWYVDVSTAYWAYDDIRILWEEEVSDGWLEQRLVGGRLRLVSVFRPDQVAARAEYGMMMVKAFRLAPRDVSPPSYADVPADLLLYDRILAQPWLEAGLAAGMLDPPPVLRPLDGLRRDAATAALVRALGLTPFSQRLSAAEVASLLGRFPDGADTDPALAGLVALAVHLRILEGYPDGTLQPGRLLSRAEAATILARAALFGLKAAPNPASPDGDGIGDTITFSVRALRNRNASRWGAYVGDLSGYVRKALADGLAGAPPPTVVWDGRDDTGARLPPGMYYYWGWLEDVLGQRYEAPIMPLELLVRRLEGTLTPVAAPGESVVLTAWTRGRALSVTAVVPGRGELALVPGEPPVREANAWTGTWRVDPALPDGVYTVAVTADFGDVVRRIDLSLTVRTPFSLLASLRPNPVAAGRLLTVEAVTQGGPESVRAHLPWGETVSLAPAGEGLWSAAALVPEDAEPGAYAVSVEATRRGEVLRADLDLFVEDHPLRSVRFVLTD